MSSKKRLLAVAMATVLLLSPITAAGAIGSTAANDPVANDSLVVGVEEAGNDGATVTVTHDNSTVENASVTVTDENDTYEGAGSYTTDENGTVELPEPEETVTVEVTAAKGNLTGETTATLTGADETDEEDEKQGTFGQLVSSFVQEMLNAGSDDGAIGQEISEFVTSNNPGSDKKSDRAGKPDDAGKPDHASKSGDAGEQNATGDDDEQGPPEHAGQNDDADENEEDGEDGEGGEDGEDEEDGKKGNSGNGKKNGHDKNKDN